MDGSPGGTAHDLAMPWGRSVPARLAVNAWQQRGILQLQCLLQGRDFSSGCSSIFYGRTCNNVRSHAVVRGTVTRAHVAHKSTRAPLMAVLQCHYLDEVNFIQYNHPSFDTFRRAFSTTQVSVSIASYYFQENQG